MDQPLQNQTSKDEIMHDQVDQGEFENSNEDQIMQDNLDYSSVWDRSRYPMKRNTGERQGDESNPENKAITRRCTRPTRGIRPTRFREM